MDKTTSKRAALYAAIVVGLASFGLVVTSRVFDLSSASTVARPNPASSLQPSTPPFPQQARSIPMASELRVLSVEGEVNRIHRGSDKLSSLSQGDVLGREQGVRTGDRARVQLGLGGESTIELKERGELSVVADDDTQARIKLLGGRLDVDFNEPGRRIQIESRDGESTASAERGHFTVLQAGETVAVATRTGVVDLSTGGAVVKVPSGMQSVVSGGKASPPEPMDVDLLLRVVDPGCLVQRESFIVLSGKTTIGARVMAAGVEATVRPDGRFFARVPLRVGRNDIEVVSEDAAGHRKTRTFSCVTVDPGAPIKGIEIKWGPTAKSGSSP